MAIISGINITGIRILDTQSYDVNYLVVAGGGSGGSGIVIFGYSGTQRGSGGNVSSAGGNTYHTFTSSGTYIA